MKKLIRNTAIFILPLILLMFIADWFLSAQLRNSRDNEFSVWNDIYNGKVKSDVVIYGSSRAMVHLDPDIIRDSLHVSAYNLGINGHNFRLQYFRHKELMKYNGKPGFIIHSVDIFTLARRNDLFNMEQFLPYMLFNEELHQWIKPYLGYKGYDYYLPLVRYYGQFNAVGQALKSAFQTENCKSRHLGYAGQNLIWNDDLDKAKRKFPDYRAVVDPETLTLFDQYLRDCQKEGIPVILVYSPEYIEGQDFVKNRNEIISTFSMFAAKYNIPFLDYSNDSISYKKDYFYNASHLNKLGATVFTNKLISDIRNNNRIAHLIQTSKREVHQASLSSEFLKMPQ